MEGKSKSGEIVLIVTIIGFVAALALLLPPVRNFLFHHGAADSSGVELVVGAPAAPVEEPPRNQLPMGQYTMPSIFRKMRYVVEDKNGGKRAIYYYWYGPRGLPPGTKLPMVVVLHDHAGADAAAIYLRSTAVQREFPSFLLIPQSPAGKVWASPKRFSGQEFIPPMVPQAAADPAFQSISDVIELTMRLAGAAAVDENRIYVIGCDEGGTGVYGALANYPGLFAAGVEVGGIWSYLDASKLAKTPLLLLQGLADTTISPDFTRNMNQIVKGVGGKTYLGEFKGLTHDCDSPTYYSRAVWAWLFSQRRIPPLAPSPQVVSTPAAPAAVPAPVAQ